MLDFLNIFKKKKVDKKVPAKKTRAAQLLSTISGKKTSIEFEKELKLDPRFPHFSIRRSPQIIPLPDIKEKRVVRYPLIEPYAYASINWNPISDEIVYNVVEPILTPEEKKMLSKIREGLIQVIDVSLSKIRKTTTLIKYLESKVQYVIKEYNMKITPVQYLRIMYYIYRDFVGLNKIEPLMHDPNIEDIGVDGVHIPAYIVHRKYGSIRTNIVFDDEEELREFVIKLAEKCDRYISYAEPLLDGALPDGSRVQASLANDVTTKGPTFSIRKFKEVPFTPIEMIKSGTLSSEMLAYLWFVVENGQNILICGGVSTGKTTLLNAISLFIPPEAKIVSIEDTRELNLPHENWIPSVARLGFGGSNVGEVSMFDLLKESFRQNPDYIIVGEVRGKEAYILFQAMSSGHPSIATMHGSSTDAILKRLETPPIELPVGLLEALDIIIIMVHAREKGKSARRLKEIDEIRSIDSENGKANYTRVFNWIPATDSFEYNGSSWVLNKISKEKGMSMIEINAELARRKKFIDWMVDSDITDMKKITKFIKSYYKDKKGVLDLIDKS